MSSAKVSFWQDMVWRLQAFFYVLVTGLIGLMPVATASAIGGFLTRKLGPLTGSQKTVVRNFKIAFPDMDPATRARLIDRQWENLGRLAFEFPHMAKFQPRFGRVEIVNGERLEEIRTSGKPAVFVSGHFANWEVMPCVIAAAGLIAGTVPTIGTSRTSRTAVSAMVEAVLQAMQTRRGCSRSVNRPNRPETRAAISASVFWP